MREWSIEQILESLHRKNFRFHLYHGMVPSKWAVQVLGYAPIGPDATVACQLANSRFSELRQQLNEEEFGKILIAESAPPEQSAYERYGCQFEYKGNTLDKGSYHGPDGVQEDAEYWRFALWHETGRIRVPVVHWETTGELFGFEETVRYRWVEVQPEKRTAWTKELIRPAHYDWQQLNARSDQCDRLHSFFTCVAQELADRLEQERRAEQDRRLSTKAEIERKLRDSFLSDSDRDK